MSGVMSNSELPQGWCFTDLGDVVQDKVEQAEPGSAAVSYIDIGSIDRSRKTIGELVTVDRTTAPTRARQWVHAGDVLVSLTRPNLNAVAMVPPRLDGAVASTGFDVLRATGVLPDWLFCRVRSTEFVADVCKDLQGVVYPAIRPRDVREHQLPLPPLPEQRRIVEAIESYFTRLDAAVAGLKRVQRNLERYRASVLQAAVEGRLVPTEAELARAEGRDYEPASVLLQRILTERRRRWEEAELAKLKANGQPPKDERWKDKYGEPVAPDTGSLPALPEGWCWTTVDVAGEVLLGRQRAPMYLTGRWSRPYLRVANIKDDRIDTSDVESMDFEPGHFEKYSLETGDILVSEGQSPHLVGQSAIYRGGIDGLCFQKTLHRFRAVPGGPSPEFAQAVFRAHVRTGVFRRLASITTNIAHLTLVKFKASPFPLPPLAEQQRIVAEVARLLSISEAAEAEIARLGRRTYSLRQSILKWAFEGKLVDQDPNDEPAETLLARIRAEREAEDATKSNGRRGGRREK